MDRLARVWEAIGVGMTVAVAMLAFGAAGASGTGPAELADAGLGTSAVCTPTWKVVPSPRAGQYLEAITFVAPDASWAVGVSAVARILSVPRQISGAGAGAASSTPLIERWDGSTWQVVSGPRVRGALVAVAGSGVDDVWAVGSVGQTVWAGDWPEYRYWALAEHWDGSSWTRARVPFRGELWGVSTVEPDDAWAVGGDYTDLEGGPAPILLHWDGTAWSKVDPGSGVRLGALTDVVALAEHDVWVIGDDADDRAVAVHWNGARWRPYRLPGNGYPSDVAALSPKDVWVSGSGDTEFMGLMAPLLWYWNGKTWAVAPAGESHGEGGIHGIAVRSPREVFLTGYDEGGPAHDVEVGSWVRSRAGTATARWRSTDFEDGTYLYDLAVDPSGNLWAVGERSPGETSVPIVMRRGC